MVRLTSTLSLAFLTAAASGQTVGVLPTLYRLGDGNAPVPTLRFDNNLARMNMHAWYRDGRDKPAVLAVVGWMERDGVAGSMATWDGVRWTVYPEVPNANHIGRSTIHDPDGPGPEPERIYAIRMGQSPSRVVMWNGTAWVPVGAMTESTTSSWGALASFDPDGDGPQVPWLVHANQRVSAWMSGSWVDLGLVQSPAPHRVAGLQPFDPDGSGPRPPLLAISGFFTAVGGAPATNVAVLNGIDWEAIPGLAATQVPGQMCLHDFDGEGGVPPELVIPVRATVGGVATELVAWNGDAVRSVVSGNYDTVSNIPYPKNAASISVPGVMEGLLGFGQFASFGGLPVSSVGRVDAASSAIVPLSSAAGAGFTSYVDSVVAVDLDGTGPLPAEVFAIGPMQQSNGITMPGVTRWNGRQWQPMTGGFTFQGNPYADIDGISVIDLDGDGPAGETTFLRGDFTEYAGVYGYGGIAAVVNGVVSPVGVGIRDALCEPGEVLNFDPDADGPAPAQLLATGIQLARFDGSLWSTIWNGTGLRDMITHDFDGQGPLPPRAIIGGFISQGGVNQYDGSTVSPVGITSELSEQGGRVSALLSSDPDGPDGPGLPLLYAAGSGIRGRILVYSGVSWNQVGSGWRTDPRDLVEFDMDGDGTLEVVGCSQPFEADPGVGAGLSGWNGTTWTRYDTLDETFYPTCMAVLDTDGDGPTPPALYIGGRSIPDTGFVGGWIKRWNVATQTLDPVTSDFGVLGVVSMDVERPYGAGGPQRLVIGTDGGSVELALVFRYSHLGRAWLTEEPADVSGEEGSAVTLTASVHPAYVGATYEWHRNGVATGFAGSFTSETLTATFSIPSLNASNVGDYQLVMTNADGVSMSRPASVTIGSSCAADFNGDDFLDFFDYDDFVGCFEIGACPEGKTADFNGDDFVDFFDYDDFVAAFETGC
jgi:hypothetical protein